MRTINIIKEFLAVVCIAAVGVSAVHAASIPTLSLTNGGSAVNISVTGADANAAVMFSFPSGSVSSSGVTTYSSINIGQTNSAGSFAVSVAPNSYSLTGGAAVYVTVDGAASSQIAWPANVVAGQSTGLSLSQQSVSFTVGQTANIYALNTSNALTLQGNSNTSAVSAAIQSASGSSQGTLFMTALAAGSANVSVCAGSAGCATVSVTVRAPTQTISFSQSPIYLVSGQPAKNISIYGPGAPYSLSNQNKDMLSATLNDSSLSMQGLAVGQTSITVCGSGWLCGTATVNIVPSGTAIPDQTVVPPTTTSGFNQPPQISSLTVSSNDVLGLFFGSGSTITLSFSANETVDNVQVKMGGQQTAVTQSGSTYYASYAPTGKESMPFPVAISFTDTNGRIGQSYFWLGDAPAALSVAASSVDASSFSKNLSLGMTDSEVSALQKRLKADAFYSGPITGYFGSQTKAAVEKYQSAHGLSKVGAVGPSTRRLLNQGI